MDDNGVTRNKEYHKIVDDEGEKITGRYVSPTQADKEVYELPVMGLRVYTLAKAILMKT